MKYPDDFINQIICGWCLEVMPNISDKSINMILCDLPYGTTACKWDIIIPFEPLWEQYKRIIKNNGAIVLFGNEPFSSYLRISNIKNYKYDWIWKKDYGTGYLNSKKQPLRIYENISVFYFNQCEYHPQMVSGFYITRKTQNIQSECYGKQNHIDSGRRVYEKYPTNILNFKRVAPDYIMHPTQKPVALFEYLIKTYTNEGDLVLDNCAGSGTTGVACKNLGRNYILIEKEDKYCGIARNRIKAIPETLF